MKLTASQTWLVHSLEVLALSASFSLVITLYQSFSAGTLTLQSAGVAAGSLLIALGSKGLSGIISNTNFMQALTDTVNEIANRQQAVSPVTIHNNIPAVAALTPAPVEPAPEPDVSTTSTTKTAVVSPIQFAPVTTAPPTMGSGFTFLETPAVQQPTQ